MYHSKTSESSQHAFAKPENFNIATYTWYFDSSVINESTNEAKIHAPHKENIETGQTLIIMIINIIKLQSQYKVFKTIQYNNIKSINTKLNILLKN